jgi:type III pantothenate kinase
MLMAIDIGNSSIKFGLFSENLVVHTVPSSPRRSSPTYEAMIEGFLDSKAVETGLSGIVISSVVPSQTEAILRAVERFSREKPLVAGPHEAPGLALDVNAPDTVGADRVAASVGASALVGSPVAMVDFGTATTVNFVEKKGREGVDTFCGGSILPGVGMMLKSLSEETARLPYVPPAESRESLGRDTEQNILSGIMMGTAGAVEKIISSVAEPLGTSFKIAVTGGHMEYVLPHLIRVDLVEPNLTLKGLKIIYERHSEGWAEKGLTGFTKEEGNGELKNKS